MTEEFNNRVALVTGGSRGIGRAIALRLAQEGCDVSVSYAARKEPADDVVKEIQAIGRKATHAQCDVADPKQVEALVAHTRSQIGPIDFLVHSGAIASVSNHDEVTLEEWQRIIDVNLTGTFLIVRAVKDEMIERRFGRIVALSSVAALRGRANQVAYSASKAGVIAITRCWSDALAPHNVRFNAIAPGVIETEMEHTLSDEEIETKVTLTPLGRIGEPEDIAGVARFLLSDDSNFMSGQTIVASGGRVQLP
ncbi:MAG: 3-oxoacyl-ACP reductase FabG [Planctomycetes bacterium]|nr:3-oxoacyl-ACP reductase FabG [Planctomycetota bacterium]